MNLWPVEHFSFNLKIGEGESNLDDKYVEKSVQLVRGSSFQNDLLQNPYFGYLLQNLSSVGHIEQYKNCQSEFTSSKPAAEITSVASREEFALPHMAWLLVCDCLLTRVHSKKVEYHI